MRKTSGLLILFLFSINQLLAQVGFDSYANINTIGISVDTYHADPEEDLQYFLEYKKSDAYTWQKGFELVKTNSLNSNLINGSIFNCDASTSYTIKVTLVDPSTNNLNGIYYDTIKTKSLISFSSFTKTYYVSKDGLDANFSIENPGSLKDALANIQGGERIVLLAGNYNVGDLVLDKIGREDAPITIEGQVGEVVILDGSETILSWDIDLSTDGYKAEVENKHCNVVIADGKRLYPFKSLKELKYNKIAWESNCRDADIDGFFRSGNSNTLRIKFRDGSDPNVKDIKIGRYNQFIRLENSEWVRFSNLHFKYYGSKNAAAISLLNSNNIQLDNCTFAFNDIGVRLEENTNNVIVDNCEFYDAYGDWNFWRMKASYQGVYLISCSGNNLIADNLPGSNVVNQFNYRGLEKGGIFVSGNYSGRGVIVKNSYFHDMVQGLSLRPQSWWTEDTGKTAEVDFYNNTVYNCSEDGLEVDVYPRNLRVWNNTFHDVNAAISIASGADGPIYIFNNIFYDFTTDTTWIPSFSNFSDGRPLKTNASNSGTSTDDTGQLYFLHNTVHAQNDHYPMDILKPGNQTWNKFTFFNNIFMSENRPSFRIRSNVLGPIISDYNCFYSDHSSLASINDNVLQNLTDYVSQYHIDSNSLNVIPLFTDSDSKDYSLSSNSSLIDAGIIIKGLNTDFNGSAPDMGAIEYLGSVGIEPFFQNTVSMYPNPLNSNDRLNIEVKNGYQNGILSIYNLDGKIVLSQKLFMSNNVVDLGSLISGAYYVQLNLDGKSTSKLIVKN